MQLKENRNWYPIILMFLRFNLVDSFTTLGMFLRKVCTHLKVAAVNPVIKNHSVQWTRYIFNSCTQFSRQLRSVKAPGALDPDISVVKCIYYKQCITRQHLLTKVCGCFISTIWLNLGSELKLTPRLNQLWLRPRANVGGWQSNKFQGRVQWISCIKSLAMRIHKGIQ